MKEIEVLVHDDAANRSWSVIACQKGVVWLTSETSPEDGQDGSDGEYGVSSIVEVNFATGKRQEILPVDQPYHLFSLTASPRYLYMALLTDANGDMRLTTDDFVGGHRFVSMDRTSGRVQTIWSNTGVWNQINDVQVLDDTWCLLLIAFSDADGEVSQRYDLVDIASGDVHTVYVDDEPWVEAQAYLTLGPNGPMIVLDRHVLPSDKRLSGGQADRITVLG